MLTGLAAVTLIFLVVFVLPRLAETIDVNFVAALIKKYGYWVIFFITVLGNMGLPVPEETTTILGGLAAREGWLAYDHVLVICILSAICGDNLGYLIGHLGGRKLLLRYGGYVGLTAERLREFDLFFEKYGSWAVFFARFIGGVRFLAGPASGMAGMNFKRFLLFNSLGAVVYVTVMTQIGYHFGFRFFRLLEKGSWALAFIVVGVFLGTLWFKRRGKARTMPL